MRYAALASLLLCAGCANVDPAALVAALGKDSANVCIHVGATMYTPEVTVARVNMQGVSAQCANGVMTTVPTPGTGTATIAFPSSLTVSPK